MENLIELLKKIITNVLTALYQPFWFAVILTVFLLFFYLYAYKPIDTGKGIRAAFLPKTRAKKRSAAFLDARYAICARLEKELKKKNMHTLLVTSAVAGEGKTTVACNLALGLEKKGYSVLLLDADLRKPAVCRTIQLDSGTEGAYEVLTGQRTAEEVKIRFLRFCKKRGKT